MSIIVTGGAGFIGSHLVELLLSRGEKVVVVDSLWTGSENNVSKFHGSKNYRFIKADVRNPLPPLENVKQIYHLACPASPDYFERAPVDILETCFKGTQNMLDLAVVNKARILIASTSEIYGDPEKMPQSEDYWGNTNSFGPRSCYDEGKRITEALAYGYMHTSQLDVRIARIFNAYGPGMQLHDGRAVPNFIDAAIDRRPLVVYGDGSATRCFQYVSDCVAGLVALMASRHTRPVNIGSDQETRLEEIGQVIGALVAEQMGTPGTVPLRFLPAREDDPRRRRPDISTAREVLGWQPMVGLRDGLGETIRWFLTVKGQQKRMAEAEAVELDARPGLERNKQAVLLE